MTPLEKATAVLGRLVTFSRERGPVSVLRSSFWWGTRWLMGLLRPGNPARASFEWDGRRVPGFHHRYHYTWLNERAVETPLALEVLREHAGGDVLEIGNVMSHYIPVDHLVVDKYERAPGVVNADVAELVLDQRFDLIFAVSTLEHVGLDEPTKDADKAARAIARLKAMLKPGGLLWVTLPVGYNHDLDDEIRSGRTEFTRLRALSREAIRNRWRQVPVEQVWQVGYDHLLFTAHGLLVAEYVAPN